MEGGPPGSGVAEPWLRCGLLWKTTSSGIFACRRRSRSSHHSRQIERETKRQRAPLTDRMHRHSDLTITDLAERARVLPLHPRRVPTVLGDPGVIDHPSNGADLRRNPARLTCTNSAVFGCGRG